MVKVESAVPLYKQIVHDLVSRIESGVYSEGDKLPTETELMEEYGVSRITVRSAIKELEDADIVERTRGKGTFVTTTRNAYAADDQESFTHSCIQENKKPSTVVLEVAWIYPTLRDVRFLQVQEDENILQTRRLRLVDGVPVSLKSRALPGRFWNPELPSAHPRGSGTGPLRAPARSLATTFTFARVRILGTQCLFV